MPRLNRIRNAIACAIVAQLGLASQQALGQAAADLPSPAELRALENPNRATREKEASLIDQVLEPELIFRVDPNQSKVVRTKLPISRVAITDPSIVEVNEFGPTEIEVIGVRAGETTMTIWFSEPDGQLTILRYLVRVAANEGEQYRAEIEYGKLQSRINEMFPYSQVQLIPIADKLIVRGQARDSKEAAEILAIITGQSVTQTGSLGNFVTVGSVAQLPGAEDLRTQSVINMLHVPGEQQVMLKVRIAEISRSAARELGLDFSIIEDNLLISNFIGGGGNITAILDGGDVNLFLRAFASNGYGKVLAEPTLVTLSGQPATFIAGGEFAVPTVVGVGGVEAASTTFRGFGTQLTFVPTVVDKDKIRLQVAPSFSTLNQDIAVNGIPGLNSRAVTTTVDLREGQWLAVAGLIQDEQRGSRGRVPYIGDIPIIGAAFGSQFVQRDETELVVLVSPVLVHPMEPEQVPPLLPGMAVTEPTDNAFFFWQMIEGHPDVHHRSTIWPQYRMETLRQNAQVLKSRFQHAKGGTVHCESQQYYMSGPQGFSE